MLEMTLSLVIVSVLILAVGGVISDSYANWDDMYDRIFGTVPESIVKIQRDFNVNCRRATLRNVYLSADRRTLIVYQFADRINPSYWPDRYVQYYLDGTTFRSEYGELNAAALTKKNTIHTDVICENVQYLSFSVQGLSVQLCITINDGQTKRTFAWAAVRHN